jgi:hypothetical protein
VSGDIFPSPSSIVSSTTFEKPQGGGKGDLGDKASPSPVSKSDNDTTTMPTINSDVEDDLVDINSDSSQFVIIAESPTYEPSAKNSIESNSTPASVEKNEFSCTGEPCEVISWCRSRYGSCGPGFIYCNANSIWDNSCPPIAQALGTRPTRTPTVMMTTEIPTNLKEELGEVVSAPTLPALPMPTLPTITRGTDASANFMSQSSVELLAPSSSEENALAKEDSFETAVSDENKEKEPETELPKETDGSISTQTPELDEWLAFTASMNPGVARHFPIYHGVILSTLAFLFCDLPRK